MRVQLEPPACRLDEHGTELPEMNDDWIIQSISTDAVSLQNVRTQHIAELGKDHIYDFRSNPSRSKSDIKHGFLVLKMQVFLQGNQLWLRANARPGERVTAHRIPLTQPNPSEFLLHIMADLAKSNGWSGTPANFNKRAACIVYGWGVGNLLNDPPDYFSALVIGGYALISSLTDHGNRPDGTPYTTVEIQLASRGKEALAKWQSNTSLNPDAANDAAPVS